MDDNVHTPIAVEIEAQITINATVDTGWTALTEGIGQWWDHSFTDKPYAIVLGYRKGGQALLNSLKR